MWCFGESEQRMPDEVMTWNDSDTQGGIKDARRKNFQLYEALYGMGG